VKLLVGLGNPGADYAKHRHTVGFMALDAVHAVCAATGWQKKLHGLLAPATLGATKLLLCKPQTFMNNSGLAVSAVMQFYKIPPADVIVWHDELELPPGKIRVKQGGGAAGHNGIKSIDAAIGQEYWRVRIGIGRPPEGREAVHDYVLHNFHADAQSWLAPMLTALAAQLPLLLAGDAAGYMRTTSLTPAAQPERV
jgi:peptidyl-tRNA hydrolase, PTH1 family